MMKRSSQIYSVPFAHSWRVFSPEMITSLDPVAFHLVTVADGRPWCDGFEAVFPKRNSMSKYPSLETLVETMDAHEQNMDGDRNMLLTNLTLVHDHSQMVLPRPSPHPCVWSTSSLTQTHRW